MMDIASYLERLGTLAASAGFTLSAYGRVGSVDLPVLQRNQSGAAPAIYLSTGVHGDEPAGPLAILNLLEKTQLPTFANLTIFPLVNPSGLAAGKRENLEGIDLNRDYGTCPKARETQFHVAWLADKTFDLSICLHEDSDGEGFYLYSHITEDTRQDLPGIALAAAQPHTGIDLRRTIDDMPAKDGRMLPPRSVIDGFGDNLPEALRLRNWHGSRFTFTTETPSGQAIENRIAAQAASVTAILNGYLGEL